MHVCITRTSVVLVGPQRINTVLVGPHTVLVGPRTVLIGSQHNYSVTLA